MDEDEVERLNPEESFFLLRQTLAGWAAPNPNSSLIPGGFNLKMPSPTLMLCTARMTKYQHYADGNWALDRKEPLLRCRTVCPLPQDKRG